MFKLKSIISIRGANLGRLVLQYLFPFIFISLLALLCLPEFLLDGLLHFPLIAPFADFICEVPVAVRRLSKALAASEALVRLLLEV